MLKISEKDFQAQIVQLARLNGFLVYHTHDSRRSAAGWPDLAMCRPPRLLIVEVKSEKGELSKAQELWRERLSICPGFEYYVWKPDMWDEIEQVLRRSR